MRSGWRGSGRRGDRGAGSVLTAMVALGLCGALLLGAWVVGWVSSVHRAGRVADLAALAGAGAAAAGGDGCARAREVAVRNGGRVETCTLRGEPPAFVLVVEVSVRLAPRIEVPGAPRRAWGSAAAGPEQRG